MLSACELLQLSNKRKSDLPEEQRQRAFLQRAAARFGGCFGDGRLDAERSGQRLQRGSGLPGHADLEREEGDASALVGYTCRGQRSVFVVLVHILCSAGMCLASPWTGMVTVCPFSAVMVAVPMVTTVCPAGMAVTMLGWSVLATAAGAVAVVLVLLVQVTLGSPSSGSTKRRRRAAPLGGEL